MCVQLLGTDVVQVYISILHRIQYPLSFQLTFIEVW